LGLWLAGNWNSRRPLGQDADGRRGRRGGPAVTARGQRLLIGDARVGGTGRDSASRREDGRAAPYGVGQGEDVRRRGVLDGLGMRAAWGRGELCWEGTRGP
jgi:hypothetical protein